MVRSAVTYDHAMLATKFAQGCHWQETSMLLSHSWVWRNLKSVSTFIVLHHRQGVAQKATRQLTKRQQFSTKKSKIGSKHFYIQRPIYAFQLFLLYIWCQSQKFWLGFDQCFNLMHAWSLPICRGWQFSQQMLFPSD